MLVNTEKALELSAVIEHAMSICSDAALLAALRTADKRSTRAANIIGRIVYASRVKLEDGQPLTCWVNGGSYDSNWSAPVKEGSLLEQLFFLRQIHGPLNVGGDLFDEWLELTQLDVPVYGLQKGN